MKRPTSNLASLIGIGVAAGLAGTAAMIALHRFDEQYAPKTIADASDDPGHFIVKNTERLTGSLPDPVEKSAAMAARLGYGALFGALYAISRGRRHHRSSLLDGAFLGASVYLTGYLGWLPTFRLTRPIWKQPFPQIAGELSRHVAYGVATTAAYGLIDSAV
jgi:hypothetical protein